MVDNVSSEFLTKMKEIFGSDEEFEKYLNSCHIPLKKSIRLNLNKINFEDFVSIVEKKGWKLTTPNFVQSNIENGFENKYFLKDIYYVDRQDTTTPLGNTFFHLCGFFYIQEISASLSARFLELEKGNIVLDMAAAPGGKTVQIADYLYKNGGGFVVSNDMNFKRMQVLSSHINRMGFDNIGVTNMNGLEFGKKYFEFFDRVLLDAPCSGEGTMFKTDFSLKYWKEKEIEKIANLQYYLLVSAVKSLKKGGILVYSTCTLNPLENEGNISKLLEKYGDYLMLENIEFLGKSEGIGSYKGNKFFGDGNIKKFLRMWPHIQETGGFFIAKIRKIKDFQLKNKDLEKNFDRKIRIRKEISSKKINEYLKNNFGFELKNNFFVSSHDKIYSVNNYGKSLLNKFDFKKIGLPILKIDRKFGFRPTHYLGVAYGQLVTRNFVILDYEGSQKYVEREEIDLNSNYVIEKNIENNVNYVVLKFQKYGLGVGKLINGKIKSKFDYKM